jgi:hypothetical protein
LRQKCKRQFEVFFVLGTQQPQSKKHLPGLPIWIKIGELLQFGYEFRINNRRMGDVLHMTFSRLWGISVAVLSLFDISIQAEAFFVRAQLAQKNASAWIEMSHS